MSHPLHDVAVGKKAPEEFQAVIEIPQGCRVKYELDKDTGLLRVDRVLYSSVFYPTNYGFIPQTLAADGDALDVLVLMQDRRLCSSFARTGVVNVIEAGQPTMRGDRPDKE